MKILIVDDSGTMRTIQRRCLNKLGITDIDEGEDGVKALEHFRGNTYDVIFTDWNMPNMNGLELLQEIRKSNTHVPVIMITTESEKSRVILAVQAGVSDYLVKPFTPDALKVKLEKWVGCHV